MTLYKKEPVKLPFILLKLRARRGNIQSISSAAKWLQLFCMTPGIIPTMFPRGSMGIPCRMMQYVLRSRNTLHTLTRLLNQSQTPNTMPTTKPKPPRKGYPESLPTLTKKDIGEWYKMGLFHGKRKIYQHQTTTKKRKQ